MRGLSVILLTILFSCARAPQVTSTSPEKENPSKDLQAVEGDRYTTLIFEKGSSDLTPESKRNLEKIKLKMQKDHKPIEAIKILAWADKEYPTKVERVSPLDVILAKDRTNEIEKYMSQKLDADQNIATYNMAKRPNSWSKIIKDDDFDLKESFEAGGLTSTRLNDGSLSYTKASKAIIIIDYRD